VRLRGLIKYEERGYRPALLTKPLMKSQMGEDVITHPVLAASHSVERYGAIQRVRDCVVEQRGTAIDIIDSPIRGMEGNHEYLLHATFRNPR